MSTLNYGSITTVASYEVACTRVCTTNSKVITYYIDRPSGDRGTISMYTLSGSTFSHVYTAAVASDDKYQAAVYPTSITEISTDKVIITWNDTIYRGRSELISVGASNYSSSGNLIIGGGEAAQYLTGQVIDTDKHVMVWINATSGLRASCITTSGTTQTEGSTYTLDAAATSGTNVSVAKLDDNKFIVVYYDGTVARAIVCTTPDGNDAAGRVITAGSPQTFASNLIAYNQVCSPDTNRFIISWDDRSTNYGESIVGTVSGTTITYGSKTTFKAAVTRNNRCCPIQDTTHALVVYQSGATGLSRIGTIDWSARTITYDTEQLFESGSIGGGSDRSVGVCEYDAATAIIIYQDDDDSDYGKIIAGQILTLDPPTSISVASGYDENTITFTADPGASSTNLYWSNIPGVSKITGTQIAGVASPYNHTGLNPSLTYYYVLTSENGLEGMESAEYSASPLPAIPTNVVATLGIEEMVISWDDSTGADSYNIYWDTTSSVSKSDIQITGVTSPYTHTGLTLGQKYYYVVTAVDEDGETDISLEVSGYPLPDIPIELSAEAAVESNILTFEYNDVDTFENESSWIWDIFGDGTHGIQTDTLLITVGDSTNYVQGTYDVSLPGADFEVDVDLIYYYKTGTDGFYAHLALNNIDSDGCLSENADYVDLMYFENDTTSQLISKFVLNSVETIYTNNVSVMPSKLRIKRSSDVLSTNYYITSWVQLHTKDYSSRADNLTDVCLGGSHNSGFGGTINFDNLTVRPTDITFNLYWDTTTGVDTIIGTKITSPTSPHTHTGLTAGQPYYYVATAVIGSSESSISTEVTATPLADVPDAPTNLAVLSGDFKNTLTWNSVAGATSYNLYWYIDYFPNEYFVDLNDWTSHKDIGDETIQITSQNLELTILNGAGEGCHAERNTTVPAGDFILYVDMAAYSPNSSTNGLYAQFRVLDGYLPTADRVEIRYYASRSGTKFNIEQTFYVDSVVTTTEMVVFEMPSSFGVTRDGNILTTYCYYNGDWHEIFSIDFGARASNLDTIVLDAITNNNYGGTVLWDNLTYYPDLKEGGFQISGVTTPYDHSSLTPFVDYYYAVTAQNANGEGDASAQVIGTPTAIAPHPPTGISATSDEGHNIIVFTPDSTADETHIYWDTSPGVTTITGTKISNVTSPYFHWSLDPSLTYYYILVSENLYGEGSPSAEYSASPISEIPSGIVATSGSGENYISWDDSTGADSYNIYWDTTTGVDIIIGTKITGVTSPYTHTGLIGGRTYYYVVTSEDEDGESGISLEVDATPTIDIPTNVYAVSSGDARIKISWDAMPGATYYDIYWALTTGVTKLTGTRITTTSTTYYHESLTVGTTYYYVVVAASPYIETSESSEVYAIPVYDTEPPKNIQQYSILEPFSENTFENITKLLYIICGTPPVLSYDSLYGNVYDMSEPMELNNCILDNSFEIELIDTITIRVHTGICIIGGTMIHVTGNKNLIITSQNSYFDDFLKVSSAGIVYVLIYYDNNLSVAEGTDIKAYIGLMKKSNYSSLTTAEKSKYCFLGALRVNSDIEIVSPIHYLDPEDNTISRPFPTECGDGGWLDVPDDFMI